MEVRENDRYHMECQKSKPMAIVAKNKLVAEHNDDKVEHLPN